MINLEFVTDHIYIYTTIWMYNKNTIGNRHGVKSGYVLDSFFEYQKPLLICLWTEGGTSVPK